MQFLGQRNEKIRQKLNINKIYIWVKIPSQSPLTGKGNIAAKPACFSGDSISEISPWTIYGNPEQCQNKKNLMCIQHITENLATNKKILI